MTTLEERVASMPKPISSRLAAACALAIVLLAVVPVTASAKRVSASLRVVGKGGKVLTEKTLRTGTMSIKTSRGANCFGKGTGGSGRSVKVRGATALGLLAQASRSTPSLRPLLITDAFDFGLGICGVGKSRVSGRASWYLKVNHRGAQVGGDAYRLHGGDEVLWDLAPSFPYPDELVLKAPEAALPGVPFRVRVLSYDEKGKRRPVSGASVTGAAAPTGADGTTTVTLTESSSLRATHGREIPSAASFVCAGVCTGGSQP
jgi:hypothetical protein